MKIEMMIKEFANQVLARVEERLYGFKGRVVDVKKNNIILTGIAQEGVPVAPTFYLNGFFEQYLEGRVLDDIVENLVDFIRTESAANNGADLVEEARRIFRSKEELLSRVVPALVGQERNAGFLADLVHRPYLDMAIYYKVVIGEGEMSGSVAVTPGHVLSLSISEEELYAHALENLEKDIELAPMGDIIAQMMGEECVEDIASSSMFVISNGSKVHGAAAILCSDALKELVAMIGEEKVFVLPSSIHECIIVRPSGEDEQENISNLREMVEEVNCTQVAPEEVLTNSVYEYTVAGGLKIAGEISAVEQAV